MIKKSIILKHGGGELANQLWNYVSIYAHGLENNILVKNPSFFEYHSFFRFLPTESILAKMFSLFFRRFRRRSHIINRAGRLKYALISKIVSLLNSSCVFSSENTKNIITYLPPTSPFPERFRECDTLFFSGWLFRNPKGMEKWRDELIAVFTPRQEIVARADATIRKLWESSSKVIGIHVRQGDYKSFKDGAYWVPQARFREILDEYLLERGLYPTDVSLFIASDGPIDESVFSGFTKVISKEDAVTDLFTLARTDIIIGSDSSFGAFASWYGNIPHIVVTKTPIDWQYYRDKSKYFENRYCTLVQR